MHIAILGAGAIGGGVGGLTHAAGHRVTLVARGAHLDALRRDGLMLVTPGDSRRLRVPATDRVPADVDLVLLAVKSHDTAAALPQIPRGVPVVCLQNGIANEARAAAWRHPVVGAMVWVPAVHLAPGEVRLHGAPGPGVIDVGDYPEGAGDRALAVRDLLRSAGFGSECRQDIMAWKRGKLLTNLAGGLEALCGEVPAGLAERLVAEAERAFVRHGLPFVPPDALRDRVATAVVPAGGEQRTGGSAWQSVARGRPMELEDLYGEVLRLAGRDGAPTCARVMNLCLALEVPGGWSVPALTEELDAPDSAKTIVVLRGLEAVRRRPGMYVGDPTTEAANAMLWEVVANSVDQVLAGRCTRIDVRLSTDGFEVADDGSGADPEALDRALTTLHAGATADGHWPHVHLRTGLHGVGLAAVSALSASLDVLDRHDGRLIRLRYECGRRVGGPEDLGPSSDTGLSLAVTIDRTLVPAPLDLVDATLMLERVVALTGAAVTLDAAPVRCDGLAGFVRRRAGRIVASRAPDVVARGVHDDVGVEAVIWFEGDDPTRGWSFVNLSATQGGRHVDALHEAAGPGGLVYGLHVTMLSPRFGRPTREWLTSEEAHAAVQLVVGDVIRAWRTRQGE